MSDTRLEVLNDLLESQIEEFKYLARYLTSKKYEAAIDTSSYKEGKKMKTVKHESSTTSQLNKTHIEEHHVPDEHKMMEPDTRKNFNKPGYSDTNSYTLIKPFKYSHSTIDDLKHTLRTKQQEIHSTITSIMTLINTSCQASASISQFYLIHSNYKKFIKRLNKYRLTHLNTILQATSQRQDRLKNIDGELVEIQQLNQLISDTIDLQDNHINNLELAMMQSKEQSTNLNIQLDQQRKRIGKWKIWKIIVVFCFLLIIIKIINMLLF